MGASTTSLPLLGSAAMSRPTPCTSPSELTRKSAYSLQLQEHVTLKASDLQISVKMCRLFSHEYYVIN